jgi:hypothetical protein
MPPIGSPDQYGGQTPAVGHRRPRGWYPEPRNRDVGRQRAPNFYKSDVTNRTGVVAQGYPTERLRVELQPEYEAVYDRVEVFQAAGVAQSTSVTFLFSGVPDAIDIMATQEAFVRFFDQNLVLMRDLFFLPANQVYESFVQARQVSIGNNAVGAADVSVIAKWRKPLPIEPRQADIGAPR